MKLFAKNKPDSSISNAKSLYTKGNYKKALKICKNILDEKDYDFEAQNLLGDIYYKMGNKSKALEMYRTLGEKLEQDKFTERAIAVTRKIIRFFPEQYDLYRKLSQLYKKKGLTADQLNILYELSDIYHKKGDKEKAVDILKEIAEIDRNTAENYYKIISRFCEYGKTEEACKYSYYAAKLASEQKKKDILNKVIDITIENNCDITNTVKYAAAYFKANPEKQDVFKYYAKAYLLQNFDSSFFEEFTQFVNYSNDPDFFETLKNTHNNILIYKHILENLINDNKLDKIPALINEIIDLPDYNFGVSIIDVVRAKYREINNAEVLDSLATLSEKCDGKDLSLDIYKRMRDIYEKEGNAEKSEMLTQFISDLENSGEISSINEDVGNGEKTDFSGLEDLIEHTNFEENIDGSSDPLASLDLDLEANVDSDDFFGEKTEMQGSSDNGDANGSEEEETDIELDLSDLQIEEDKNDYDTKDADTDPFEFLQDSGDKNDVHDFEFDEDFEEENDLFDNKDISNNNDREIDDDFSKAMQELEIDEINEDDIFDEEDKSEDSRVNEVEHLISAGYYDAAQKEIDLLLNENPDDEKLKDLATQLILIEDDNTENDSYQPINKNNNLNYLSEEFTNIANVIRKRINEKVDEEDYENHYDLAMAYLEMELYEDALDELNKSATGNKRYDSLLLMAECHKKMKEYHEAINLHKLIVVDYPDTEKVLNSLYEIANIYEIQNNFSTASDYYKKIYLIDENFRDVKEKIKNTSSADAYYLNYENKMKESNKPTSADENDAGDNNYNRKRKKISYL